MSNLLKDFTFNKLIFVVGMVLWGGLTFAGRDIPGWLQLLVTGGAGAAMVYQGFSDSITKKKEEVKDDV